MSDFQSYMLRKAETRAAQQEREAASARYELATIKERLAEILSQQEPLSSLLDADMSDRDRLYAAAHYVVIGRFPAGIQRKPE